MAYRFAFVVVNCLGVVAIATAEPPDRAAEFERKFRAVFEKTFGEPPSREVIEAARRQLIKKRNASAPVLKGKSNARTTFNEHSWGLRCIAVSPDGRLMASASHLEVVIRDVRTGRALRKITRTRGGLAFSPKGRLLACIDLKGIAVFDVRTGEKRYTIKTYLNAMAPHYAVAFSPDGKRIALGGIDGPEIWELASGKKLQSWKGHTIKSHITAIAFSPDGKTLATANWGGYYNFKNIGRGKAPHEVKLWDGSTGKELRTLNGGGHGLAFSPDGKLIASGDPRGSAMVWTVATGKRLHELAGHTGRVNGVAFGPNGRVLATAGADKTIKVWNLNGKGEPRVLTAHTGEATCVAFNRTGTRLFSGSEDRSFRIWEVRLQR